jgi:enoyl-CoA hydratase/carnithine racemase
VAEAVLITREGPVFTLTINRAERRNALNEAVAQGLMAGLDAAEADAQVRAVVITGAGADAFCAGGDLKPTADGAPFALNAADPRHYVVALLKRMDACRLPLVARLNGHALAGGFGLACACDLVVAREDAWLGVPEVKVGLFPMMILPYLLRVVPYRTLMRLCLSGEPISASEAARYDIVNAAVPAAELDAKLASLLAAIVDKSPTGQRLGKQALAKIREMSLESALEYTQFMLANMARTQDAREGFAAFNERRAAAWTGE